MKKNSLSLMAVFFAMLLSFPVTASANILSNPGFESGTASWVFYTGGTGTFAAVSPGYTGNNSAKISITTASTNIQLYQIGITLEPDTAYRLKFAAYSSTGRDMVVRLQKHTSPYTVYGPDYTANLGTGWQAFTKEFNTTGFYGNATDARLMFWLAPYAAAGEIYRIDDVVLEKIVASADIIPPAAITDLAAASISPDSVTVTWTAPGDDGAVGTASRYDIRYSTSPIANASWDTATQATGEPLPNPAGTRESYTVASLNPVTQYYFAVKAADEAPNWSGLSNVIGATTDAMLPVSAPAFNPAQGVYESAQNVYLTTDTAGATIRFTTNGSDPAETSPAYSAPIYVQYNTTIKAKAFKSGMLPSSISTATYAFNGTNVIPSGLAGWWKFDEASGNYAADSSVNGNGGMLVNGPAHIAGKAGNALQFDGLDDYVELGNPNSFPAGISPRTMCLWMRPDVPGATNGPYAFFYGTRSANQAMYIGQSADRVYGGAWASDVYSNAGFLTVGVWSHVCLTYDGTSAILYGNGNPLGSKYASGWNLVKSTAQMSVDWQGNHYFKGAIDEAKLYSRALSASEVLAEYNAGMAGIPDNTAPAISSVTASDISLYRATISWATGEPADSQIEYGTTAGYGHLTQLNASFTASHLQILQGLNSSTTYHYRVKSKDAAGNLAVSEDNNFTTAEYVAPVLTSITVLPSGASIVSGATQAFAAYPKDQFGNAIAAPINWASSNTDVGIITQSGLLASLAEGSAIVTASSGAVSGNATVTVVAAAAANLIQNPSFESGTTPWVFYTGGTGTFAAVSPGYTGNNSAKISITTASTNIQLYQIGITLEPDTAYRLKFAAYSSTGRDMVVRLQKHTSPYTVYGPDYTANLGTGWQAFTKEFNTTGFSGNATDARLMFWLAPYAAAGEIYRIDDVVLEKIVASPEPPRIITPPAAKAVFAGQSATFSVTAEGSAPLAYQWQKNGTNIDRANSSAYTTPMAAQSDNGAQFRAIVSNAYGSATSNAAILTVKEAPNESIIFTPYSSSDGYMAVPSAGVQLTSSIVGDIDSDGIDDFVIAQRDSAPAIVWYKKNGTKWNMRVIEPATIPIDVGSSLYDVDKDGDMDIFFFGDWRTSEAWWWENPGIKSGAVYAAANWTRHLIKNTGNPYQHDAKFGDFDGDAKDELAWIGNSGTTTTLYVAEIPANPRNIWTNITAIYTFAKKSEGMDAADIDLDGKADIISGGGWFKHNGGTSYTFNLIGSASDRSAYESRSAAGQIVPGGRPEVVFGAGDFFGSIAWYEWNGTGWLRHELDNQSVQGHSMALGDLDGDGDEDIFVAEMTNWGSSTNPNSKMRIYRNNGDKTFTEVSLPTGVNNHESKLGDFNGDGRLDILSKSYSEVNPPAPQLIVWLQAGGTRNVTSWQYKRIDNAREKYGGWYGWFGIDFADINNDGYKDVVSGKYYYKNPGADMMGVWNRTIFPINADASLAANVDGDAFPDVISFGFSSAYTPNPGVYWLEKNGSGDATSDWTARLVVPIGIIQPTAHSQPQGFRMAQIVPGGREEIVFSGNTPGKLFYVQIPSNPEAGNWPVTVISASHNTQGLAIKDINRDGYLDAAGVRSDNNAVVWWENPGIAGQANWPEHFIGNATPVAANIGSDGPDRVELADLDGDGRMDVILTDEVWSGSGDQPLRAKSRTYWFSQPANLSAAANWGMSNQVVEQQSTNSLNVADIDNDGDADVITGEHKGAKELAIWRNNGAGMFTQNVIGTGNENHNGAQLADLDGDGDLDIVSPTWDDNYVAGGLGLLHMWRNDNSFGARLS